MANEVKKGDFVQVHYTGTLDDGSTFDSSKDREALEILAGEGMLIKGFDEALIGMKEGDEKKVTIKSEDAYGDHKEEMVRPVPRKEFGDMELKVGMTIGIKAPTGQVFPVTVKEVKDEEVIIDANHPLAGKTLHFDLKVQTARTPTQEDMIKFMPQGSGCGNPDCGCATGEKKEGGCGPDCKC